MGLGATDQDGLISHFSPHGRTRRSVRRRIHTHILHRAGNNVNSRRLTVEFSDPDRPQPITPMQLLTLKAKVVLPPPGFLNRPDMYGRKRWKRVQFLANQFWQRWRREYLQNLQTRRNWQSPRRNMQIGGIVIDKEGDLLKNQWPLARVNKIYT